MNSIEVDNLLKQRMGFLEEYNQWDLWDEISKENQLKILYYYESTPLFFDFKTIFNGYGESDIYHGPISNLGVLFVIDDLEIADQLFKMFFSYSPINYCQNSRWGNTWKTRWLNTIETWENIVLNSANSDVYGKQKQLDSVKNLLIEHIYWSDAHFFVQKYSQVVYKLFLNGKCTINRFLTAYNFCYRNIDVIKQSITKVYGWDKPLRNGIIDQYLVYLRKNKQYNECIEVIKKIESNGWRNDFEKQLKQCYAQIQKSNKS